MAADQAIAPLVIPEDDQVFTHESYRLHGSVAGELIDESGRLPVATQQGAGGSAGCRAGDEIVLFRAQHRQFLFRHPEVQAKRASKGDGPGASAVHPSRLALSASTSGRR
jgi:hypothetical protein